MQPLLLTDDEGLLLCPQCGSEWTHVDLVKILTPTGNSITANAMGEDKSATVGISVMAEQTSSRRHEMQFLINCEQGCNTVVSLLQHKGNTETKLMRNENLPAWQLVADA